MSLSKNLTTASENSAAGEFEGETMTDRELLDYIQRILQTCSQWKASLTLAELREILSRVLTPEHQLRLLDEAILNLPEAKTITEKNAGSPLTMHDLQIAADRGAARRIREAELRDFGRC